MAFPSGTQARLVKALSLSRDQYQSSSQLAFLMTELETFDADNGTALVDDVVTCLDEIDSIDETIEASVGDSGIVSESASGEFSVTYRTDANLGYKQSRDSKISQIRELIDPDGLLYSYTQTSKVVVGL